jgi:hypothetical protein
MRSQRWRRIGLRPNPIQTPYCSRILAGRMSVLSVSPPLVSARTKGLSHTTLPRCRHPRARRPLAPRRHRRGTPSARPRASVFRASPLPLSRLVPRHPGWWSPSPHHKRKAIERNGRRSGYRASMPPDFAPRRSLSGLRVGLARVGIMNYAVVIPLGEVTVASPAKATDSRNTLRAVPDVSEKNVAVPDSHGVLSAAATIDFRIHRAVLDGGFALAEEVAEARVAATVNRVALRARSGADLISAWPIVRTGDAANRRHSLAGTRHALAAGTRGAALDALFAKSSKRLLGAIVAGPALGISCPRIYETQRVVAPDGPSIGREVPTIASSRIGDLRQSSRSPTATLTNDCAQNPRGRHCQSHAPGTQRAGHRREPAVTGTGSSLSN